MDLFMYRKRKPFISWLRRRHLSKYLIVCFVFFLCYSYMGFDNEGKPLERLRVKRTEGRKEKEEERKLEELHTEENLIDLMETVSRRMKERKKLVKTICKELGLGKHNVKGKTPLVKYPPMALFPSYYILQSHNLAFCPIYKSASTTWLYNFCLLSGIGREELDKMWAKRQLSEITREVVPQVDYPEADELLQVAFKFMIVRHPFDRILSAYRDKLENIKEDLQHGVLFFHEKYGKHIVANYRKTTDNTSNNHEEASFSEFVDYLIDTDLITHADDHWMPYYVYCTPCSVSFDAIGKMETLMEDQQYIIERANVSNVIQPEWKHKTKGTESSQVAIKYFSQLTKSQVYKLYKKYELDFRMFNYSPDGYLAAAKS